MRETYKKPVVSYLKTVSGLFPGVTEGNNENYDEIGNLRPIIEGKTSEIQSISAKHSIHVGLATKYCFCNRQPNSNPANHYNTTKTILTNVNINHAV
jgi:hypothetical protein